MAEKYSPLPIPPKESVVYEDEWLYVCLASYPLTRGHTIVVWKDKVSDLRDLSDAEHDYLMAFVDIVRDALLETYRVEKVYLIYMDEAKQVHWHLVPRYDKKGVNVLAHEPQKTADFADVPRVREALLRRCLTRQLFAPAEKVADT